MDIWGERNGRLPLFPDMWVIKTLAELTLCAFYKFNHPHYHVLLYFPPLYAAGVVASYLDYLVYPVCLRSVSWLFDELSIERMKPYQWVGVLSHC